MEYLSKERYDELATELNNLMYVEFPKLTRELAEARAQGDLSENFEYHACKRAQGKMMGRIRFLQRVLQYAKVLDTTELSCDVVGLLRKVEVSNLANGAKRTYTIVNPHESNMMEGKLSVKSPIAMALNGKHVGDIVEVHAPAGILRLKIESISVD